MRMDVTREEFDALDCFRSWAMCLGSGPNNEYNLDHRGRLLHDSKIRVCLVPMPRDYSTFGMGCWCEITFELMHAVSELFQTTNLNIISDYEADPDEILTGGDFDVWINVRV